MAEESTTEKSRSGAERRVTVRLPSRQEAPCHFATLERIECRWAKVRDFSKSGVGLVLACALEPGLEVVIELPSKNLQFLQVTARVVRLVAQDDGTWLAGCVFVQPLNAQELASLS